MKGVLEVRRGDEHGIHVLAGIELVVVATDDGRRLSELLERRGTGLAPEAPDVGDRDDLEVQFRGVFLMGGDQAAATPIRETDDADADAVVGTDDAGVAACRQGGSRGCRTGRLQELSTIWH